MKNTSPDTSRQIQRLQETVERLQQENRLLKEKARHADSANKAKSDFLAMISHEIRTPMNGVIGLSELLLGTGLEKRQKHFAELILASARNLLTLINSLLDFSKIEAKKMTLDLEAFDLNGLLFEVVELFVLSGRQKNLRVSARIDPRLHSVYIGDAYRIRQILVNLLGNAVKFTEKGEVELVVKVMRREEQEDLLRFEVRDTGLGIAPEKQGELFQPFTQLDGPSSLRYSGTGLGLSICAKLIELMKGAVGLTSKPGKGSTFWFQIRLPFKVARHRRDASVDGYEPGKTEQAERENHSADRYRVLIVDDDPTNRMVLRETFQNAGVRVTEGVNGREAVDLCAGKHFDLVFMDCQMPVMDGFESTVKILSHAEHAGVSAPAIVALTADATKDTRQRCGEAGMVDYLLKPLDFDELQKVVSRFLPDLGGSIQGRHIIVQEKKRGAGRKKEVIDDSAIEKLRRNIGDIRPVVKVFIQSLEGRLLVIEEAVNRKDAENITRSAHTLKGSCGQFGAKELVELCRQMENMGRSGSIAQADALLAAIRRETERLKEVLSKQLD